MLLGIIVFALAIVIGGPLAVLAAKRFYLFPRSPAFIARRKLDRRLAELNAARRELHESLARAQLAFEDAQDAYVAGRREDLFRAISLEDLRAYGAHNVRWGGLREHGVNNLSQLHDVLHRLESFQGIGATSSARIRVAVKAATDEIMARGIAKPRPGQKDPEARAIERTEAQLRLCRTQVSPVLRELDRVHQEFQTRADELPVTFWRFLSAPETLPTITEGVEKLHDSLGRNIASARTVPAGPVTPEKQQTSEPLAAAPDLRAGLEHNRGRGAANFSLDTRGLSVQLRKYQSFGARFLLANRRTILGDEMGLGKTIEALAAINHLARIGGRHFLVVAPAGVIHNWKNEILNRTTLEPRLLHGADRDGAVRRWVAQGGVGITSYSTLRTIHRNFAQPNLRIAMSVFDEAHYVKNPDALRTRASSAFAARSEHACLMTGTPMENRPAEFLNLIAMLNAPLAAELRLGDGVVGPDLFRDRISDLYLRRNQVDVLEELPQSIENEDWVDLNSTDLNAYVDAVQNRKWHSMRQTAVLGSGRALSSKLERLRELFAMYRDEGEKVVVFSYYHAILDAVSRIAGDAAFGPLTGKVSPRGREELIQHFRDAPGFAVLPAQIEAGGVGINLQFASVVILMEPQLKPSAEDQAIARLKRMGQKRAVMVHRLFAEGTLEEDILEILGEKRRQFDAYARESLASAMAPDATEAAAVTAIIERQTLRLAARGLLPESAVRSLERPQPVQAPRSRETGGKPVQMLPAVSVDAGHDDALTTTFKPVVVSTPPIAHRPAWIAGFLARSEVRDALRSARIPDDLAARILLVFQENDHETDLATLAENLDLDMARTTRLLGAFADAVNQQSSLVSIDFVRGEVRLDPTLTA